MTATSFSKVAILASVDCHSNIWSVPYCNTFILRNDFIPRFKTFQITAIFILTDQLQKKMYD